MLTYHAKRGMYRCQVRETSARKENKKMKYYTADKEAGNKIEAFNTVEEALKAIAAYEAEDEKNDTYTPDFYDVVNEDHESVI